MLQNVLQINILFIKLNLGIEVQSTEVLSAMLLLVLLKLKLGYSLCGKIIPVWKAISAKKIQR